MKDLLKGLRLKNIYNIENFDEKELIKNLYERQGSLMEASELTVSGVKSIERSSRDYLTIHKYMNKNHRPFLLLLVYVFLKLHKIFHILNKTKIKKKATPMAWFNMVISLI